jgi:filamentous hemagglutinin family protein
VNNAMRLLLLAGTALVPAWAAFAQPQGGQVVRGNATISQPNTNQTIINQQSNQAIINWLTFNIGYGQTTQFIQPSASSVALNRVTGGLGPSQIYGTLSANGRVFLINPDGLLVGPTGVINTGGFLASTHDITNDDFMAGRFQFTVPGNPAASIVNLGAITASSGGFAALVAPGVRNAGVITADLGTVGLAASGQGFTLDLYGDKLITLGVGDTVASQVKDVATGLPLSSLVKNEGLIRANGGRVELTAAQARTVVDSVINNTGVIEANSVGTKNGLIVLGAATGATKDATAPTQKIKLSGRLSAAGKNAGEKGGKIQISGEAIEITNAAIDASGQAGGGKVLIGGDTGGGKSSAAASGFAAAALETTWVATATTVSIDAGTTINASALASGNGGKVIVWSDGTTTSAGTVLAAGAGNGSGGFIETSGKSVDISGTINAGQRGLWLLDPDDLTINAGLAATISSSLNAGTDVLEQTTASGTGGSGDITVAAQINWASAATLTLSAYRNITINDVGLNGTIKNTGSGGLVLRADNTGSGTGTINLPAGTFSNRIDWSGSTGQVSFYYNPTSYTAPTNFTTGNGHVATNNAVPGQFTAYMLVNTDGNLSAIANNLSGTYALGRDISGGAFTPIAGAFNGLFDGQNQLISGLSITSTGPTNNNIGLFSSIGSTGTVRNLFLDSFTVTANSGLTTPGQFIGPLAGMNLGTIQNVFVTGGTVTNGTVTNGVIAGGLVGQNQGTINFGTSSANVTVGSSTTGAEENNAGGLVGYNWAGGSIYNSLASGNVTGGSNSNIGGLAGRNDGSIELSDTIGNVTLNATGSVAGGLVGRNNGSIIDSSSINTVIGQNQSTVGGLVGLNDTAGSINGGFAISTVIGGNNADVGGLVGLNNGAVNGGFAAGDVSGGDSSAVGGLIGWNANLGNVVSGYAFGNVSGGALSNVGGFVGVNGGQINDGSAATLPIFDPSLLALLGPSGQTVSGGNGANIGGFVGWNTTIGLISEATAASGVSGSGNNAIGGFAGVNEGSLMKVAAIGNVQAGTQSTAGGLIGLNRKNIQFAFATGGVSAGGGSLVGGLVGANVSGAIDQAFATGNVSLTGSGGSAGGFAGINATNIGDPTAAISNVYATGAVTAPAGNTAGGLVGQNSGSIAQTYSTGLVSGGGTLGGLIAQNSVTIVPPIGAGLNLASSSGSATNSYWDTQTSGQSSSAAGSGRTSQELVGTLPPGFDPTIWAIGASDYPYLVAQPAGYVPTNFNVRIDPTDSAGGTAPTTTQQTAFFITTTNQDPTPPPTLFVSLPATTPPVNAGGQPPPGPKSSPPGMNVSPGPPPGPGIGRTPDEQRHSGVPAANESRFVKDEVLLQIDNSIPSAQVMAVAQQLGMTLIASQNIGGRTVYRFNIGKQDLRRLIAALETKNIVASAGANYQYHLTQTGPEPAGKDSQSQEGDAAQYIVEKWRLNDVHRRVRGDNINIAVIDSEIDTSHPDLAGVVTEEFDALGTPRQAHSHGTGMAGAIASHNKLIGVSPDVKIFAVRAFGENAQSAEGTSYSIVRGLQWAIDKKVRIINMSFAGPRDPMIERMLKTAKDNGIVLVAAAGNAGPKSPPLFPGADPNVIAVTATDINDTGFAGANRGKYIAIAAPGVDILVPGPDNTYQLTTGTSVASAHITGVVALLLQRDPSLTPDGVRALLTQNAKALGKNKADQFGAGLVDPEKALDALNSRAGAAQPR